MRQCTQCKRKRRRGSFRMLGQRLATECRDCERKRRAAYYAKHIHTERTKARDRWRAAHGHTVADPGTGDGSSQ